VFGLSRENIETDHAGMSTIHDDERAGWVVNVDLFGVGNPTRDVELWSAAQGTADEDARFSRRSVWYPSCCAGWFMRSGSLFCRTLRFCLLAMPVLRTGQAWADAAGPLARLVGAEIGAASSDVLAAARAAGRICNQSQVALVCGSGPRIAAEATYWLHEGQVSRIYLVAQPGGTQLADFDRSFQDLRIRVGTALGRDASEDHSLPSWLASLSPEQQRRAFVEQHLTATCRWPLPGVGVSLSLRSEQGVPIVVLAIEPDLDCSSKALTAALFDMHPPAEPRTRAASARLVAACVGTRAAGALAASLVQDPEPAVRIEVARALGSLPSPVGRQALEDAARNQHQPEVQKEALRGLIRQGASESVTALAADVRQPAELRRLAKHVLLEAAEPAVPAAPTIVSAPGSPAVAAPVLSRQATPRVVASGAPERASPEKISAGGTSATPVVSQNSVAPPRTEQPAEKAQTQSEQPKAASLPEPPKRPVDGTALAIVASAAAGGFWGASMSLLAQQSNPGVVALVGGAGAVIGGGTAWGITHFGWRPTPAEALWYTNATAWGTLAGLMAWSGSGSESLKLKYGLLVGGETAGIAMGIAGGRLWSWTPSQVLLANSLLVGAGLAGVGTNRLIEPQWSARVSPAIGYATAPAMAAAAAIARYLPVTGNDVVMMSMGSLWGGWSGSLIASGAAGQSWFGSHQGQGGLMLGFGAGFLSTAALSPFVEVQPRYSLALPGAMLVGNVFGLGTAMLADPRGSHWALGAGLGGVGYTVGALALAPQLRPGSDWLGMTAMGTVYGAGTWLLASQAGATTPGSRVAGGAMVGGVAAGTLGLVGSQFFHPEAKDHAMGVAAAAAGMSAGLGLAKLTTDEKGTPELIGVLSGAATGFAGGALYSHYGTLRPPSLLTGAMAGGYGLLAGALAPSLRDDAWANSRRTAGGAWLGLGLGALGGTALGQWQGVSYRQSALAAVAGSLGAGIGAGAGMMVPDATSRSERIGVLAGPAALTAGAFLLDGTLHLSEGAGSQWPWLSAMGIGVGMLNGGLVARVMTADDTSLARRQTEGGLLLGGSLGLASGLVLSKYVDPTSQDYFAVGAASALGLALGQGVGQLAVAADSEWLPSLRLAGALAGLAGSTVAAHSVQLRWIDMGAASYGTAYGGLVGLFASSLRQPRWQEDRYSEGGAFAGMAAGGLAAATAAHASGASAAQIQFAANATALGLAAGYGLGLALPYDSSRPERVGLLAGSAGFLLGAITLDSQLHLSNGQGLPSPNLMSATGALVGGIEGGLLAGAMDDSGVVNHTPGSRLAGGALFGASVGAGSGFLLSRLVQPSGGDILIGMGGGVLGGTLGLGTARLITQTAGRSDTLATMGGSLGLMAGTAVASHWDAVHLSAPPLLTGLGYGALVGVLAPSLGDQTWPGWTRKSQGGLLAGGASGALAGTLLAGVTDATNQSAGLAALGGANGLAAGLGFGLLLDDRNSRGARIGVVAGSAAGLAVGATLWPRLTLDDTDPYLIGSLTVLGMWNGVWLPALGHSKFSDVNHTQQVGGLLAGGAAASLAGTGLASFLRVDKDLMFDGLLMDALWTGAAAGAGALASDRSDVRVAAALGGGLAGLVLGSSLHNSITMTTEDAPLLALSTMEGLWLGAWLPRVLYKNAEVNQRNQIGGLVAGGAGSFALATLASPWVKIDGSQAAVVGTTSAVGAALAGGSVLLADDLHDRRGVGITLGGTALGLGVGAVLAPRLTFDAELSAYLAGGTLLGAGEGLVFAWAGRASTNADYAGAALLGGGLGATLGLASGLRSGQGEGQGAGRPLAAGGFAAWGAWVGAFTGALVNRNGHEVTMGGLAGANLGAAVGYGLLAEDWVEPRDFGWISLFGAAGAVLGGGVGAVFSSKTDPRPVLAGLTLGPAVGITAGALVLPRLRSLTRSDSVSFFDLGRRQVAALSVTLPDATPAADITSAEVLAGSEGPGFLRRAAHHLGQAFEITEWAPMVGALPAQPGAPSGSTPVIFGVSGFWK
jgi:hypothetical protein